MTSLPLWINRRCAKCENLPTQKKVILCVHRNNAVLNFTEFKKYHKIRELYGILNAQVLNSQFMMSTKFCHGAGCPGENGRY